MNFDKPVCRQLLKRKALDMDSCVPKKKKNICPQEGWTVEEIKLSNNYNHIIEKKDAHDKENLKPKSKIRKKKYKASTTATGQTKNTSKGSLIIKTPKVVRKKILVKANTIVESSNAKDTENEAAPIRSADNQESNPPASAPEKTINEPETPVEQLSQPVRQSQRSSVQKINSVKHPVIIDETIDVNDNDMTITDAHPLHRVDEKQSTVQNKDIDDKELVAPVENCKENGEQPTSGDKTAETNETPEDVQFDNFFQKLLILNDNEPIDLHIKNILRLNGFKDLSKFSKCDIENVQNFVREHMIYLIPVDSDYLKYYGLFHQNRDKFVFNPVEKMLLEELIEKAKEQCKKEKKKAVKTSETDVSNNGTLGNNSSTNQSLIVDLINTKKFVDKTEFIEPLLSRHQRKRIMVVRPRRFGKTYFLLTIAEICKGIKSKYLFKNYAIGKGKYDWQYYPVIFLNLSDLVTKSIKKCEDSFRLILNEVAEDYGLQLRGNDVKLTFKFLIHDLNKKKNRPVVILIDEYDTPVLRTQNKNEKFKKKIRQIVKDILETCKSQSNFIKLTFITGITTCCLSDMYLGPNDISKCTYNKEFATAFGFTESEIKETFKTGLTDLKNELNKENNNNQQITDDGMIIMLKEKFKGYYFSVHGESVYNPWSIRQCFDLKHLSNYWYNSNHMTAHFVENIMDNPDQYKIIDKLPMSCTQEELDMDKMQEDYFKQVLLQAGYLTINYNKNNNQITLDWPNKEVKYAFEQTLMKVFFKKNMKFITNGAEIINDLEQSNIDSILAAFNLVLSSYPPNCRTEKFHHELMFHILKTIGLFPISEYRLINRKKLDTAFNVKNIGYIFEYGLKNVKLSNSENANEKLKQIRKKEYFKVFEEKEVQMNVDKIFMVAIILENEGAICYKQQKVMIVNNKYEFQKHIEREIKRV